MIEVKVEKLLNSRHLCITVSNLTSKGREGE